MLFFLVLLVGLGFIIGSDDTPTTASALFGKLSFTTILLLFVGFVMYCISYDDGYEEGQKNALKGKNSYKMEIRYKVNNTKMIPVDTIFTLKK